MEFEEFREVFEKAISDVSSPIQKYKVIAATIGTAFNVRDDEIAIFSYDSSREMLVFVWPQSLVRVGSIPLNAHRCLVSKTAIEKKAVLDNNFASTPHLYMFEHFLSDKAMRVPIQKIISVPVVKDNQVRGVVQIARKGQDRDSSGADFSSADLALLGKVSEIIAGYL